jgi:uncharacterized protein (DUF427 family)
MCVPWTMTDHLDNVMARRGPRHVLQAASRVKILKRGGGYMRAVWNNAVLAESDETVVIEGNHYFPPDSIRVEFMRPSDTHTTCPWKGQASYYDVVVGGEVNKDAAWYYPEVKEAAAEIKGRVAFWKGVRVEQ